MTKISIYQIDDYVTANDKWIGTDVNTYNKTKNFTPKKVAKYFNENEVIDTSNSIRYRYDTIAITDSRKQGTLSFETEVGATVPIDNITTFILSKDTQGGKDVSNFLNILPTTKVILHKSDDIDIFGLFRIVSVNDYIVEPGFFVVTLDFLSGNGSLEEDNDYIISIIDLQNVVQVPQLVKETFDYESSNIFTLSNVINNVLQVIVNTTSLHPEAYSYTLPSTVTILNELHTGDVITIVYNYIEEFLEVPDLQRVTDEGSVTTNSITADAFIKSGGISTEYLMADGSINSDILVKKTGDTMLGDLILNEDPSTALGAATKQYVDNLASGINFHFPVVVATDVSLVATYDNGVDGVGATLTGPSVGVLSIDGETPAYLDRVLVWQQADPIENGIYDLTTVGDSVTVYQLTRSSDADNSPPGEIHYGDYTLVLSGDTNGGFGFICNTQGVINIGVTPISYIQFNSAQAVTAGYGLQELNPNVISIDPLVTQEKITLTTTGSGAATLVSNTLNIPTLPSFLEYNETDKTVWNNGKGNINSNTTFGGSSLINLSTSINNTAFGFNSLSTLSNGGNNNTAIGVSSLSTNNNEASTAVGSQTMFYNTGGYNTAVGSNALYTGSGSSNVAIGVSSLQDITTGSNNVAIGASSGRDILVMNSSVFIGQSSIPLASGQTNQIVIGQGATGAGSNTATLGNDSITSTILKGLVKAPLTTNALIEADTTGKAVTTKEYLTSYTTAQLAGKMNNPSLTASYIPKALTATTIGNSRLLDDGTYLGIGTVNAPTKDITLGNQGNKVLGIEQSSNTVDGRTLSIEAGRTINYVPNVNFNSLNLIFREYSTFYRYGSDIYASVDNSNTIFKQTNGTGEFNAVGTFAGSQGWRFVIDGSGNFYYGNWNTTILHKQSSVSSSATVEATFTTRINALALTPSNDLYVFTGDKTYVQTNLTGAFNDIGQALPQGNSNRDNACASPSGNIYASMGGSLYKRTGGTGSFVYLNLPFSTITVYVSPNNNVYVSGNNQIYMQTNETGEFVSLGQTSRNYNLLGAGLNSNVLALVWGDSVYLQNNDVTGTADLAGGTLKLTSGTGKGTGDSNLDIYTGQKTASGTDMQIETLRARINNEGLMTLPSITNALIEADTTGKAVVTKEYVNNRLVVETSSPYTLTNADSGGIVIFTASTTLTIPTGLANGFECTFVTLSGVTLTVVSTGNTLNNATSTTMLPQLSFTLKRMLATNTYIATGDL